MSEFKIGELQEKWLQYLEQHPEQQGKDKLGEKLPNGNLQMCCLGAGGLICGAAEWNDHKLVSGVSTEFLINGYDRLGLRSARGSSSNAFSGNTRDYHSLSAANDISMTWPEIAATIRADPANFFTEPK